MSIRRISRFSCWLVMLAAALWMGCVPPQGGTGGADGSGNLEGSAGRVLPGFDDRDLEPPAEQQAPGTNTAPTGSLVFPPADVEVARGTVTFRWEATDPDQTNVDSRIFIGTGPDVFADPLLSLGLRTPPEQVEHSLTIRIPDAGTYYWGVEINDGIATVRLPLADTGQLFVVSVSLAVVLGADDVVLLCPRETQPARALTTFQWSLGAEVPLRAQVFVSRPDEENPFVAPLQVFDVADPTATSLTLTAAQALPVGEVLSWGLRLQTANEVLFTFEGQLGNLFVVGENVAPTGELLGPDEGAVLSDATETFNLTWSADPGNCEDQLNSTVFFELLGASREPTALFASNVRLEAGAGAFQVDLATAADDLGLTAGLWAWGVQADDGTDQRELTDGLGQDRSYRTFVRNPAPRFVLGPAIGRQPCEGSERQYDTFEFQYTDDNGLDTVAVRLSHAAAEADLFTAAATALELATQTNGGQVVAYLQPTATGGCVDFAEGRGVYGAELDDGVNPPARSSLEYGGPPTGACCADDGRCTQVVFEDCTDGTYQGDGTVCAAVECPLPTGACCAPSGSCREVRRADCNGDYQGDGTTCARVNCPEPPPPPDCNENGIDDADDIASEQSMDCNGNAIPDECEPFGDCNENFVQDICDIFSGTSSDCDTDGTPDECQSDADCNDNGFQDFCDVAAGTSADCNTNTVPDECDILQSSFDCNENTVPDECEEPINPVDAGTLQIGEIFNDVYFSQGDVNNDLVGTICPLLSTPVVLWEVIDAPPDSVTIIFSPASLTTGYEVAPAIQGDYVFQLTYTESITPLIQYTDTVTLTLLLPQ